MFTGVPEVKGGYAKLFTTSPRPKIGLAPWLALPGDWAQLVLRGAGTKLLLDRLADVFHQRRLARSGLTGNPIDLVLAFEPTPKTVPFLQFSFIITKHPFTC